MPQPTDLMGFGMPPSLAGELGNSTQSVTAAGTTAGGATAAYSEGHIILVTAAVSATGVTLPANAKIGTPYFIVGVGSVAPVIYPQSGGAINNAATSLTLSAATATAIMIRTSSTQWYSFPLAP